MITFDIPPNLLLVVDVQFLQDQTANRTILLDVLQILVDVQQKFYWTSSKIFIAFLNEIGNSKTFESYFQNSSGSSVEPYWMSSRIQWMSNRNSRPDDLIQQSWMRVNFCSCKCKIVISHRVISNFRKSLFDPVQNIRGKCEKSKLVKKQKQKCSSQMSQMLNSA